LSENKQTLIAQKKSAVKYADGIVFSNPVINIKDKAVKAGAIDTNEINEIKIKAVINTTNWLDSHMDVHLPGIWSKSLQENKFLMHVQEHKSFEFDKIISEGDDLKASTQTYTWKELGFNVAGKTEALVFDSNVKKERNPYMFNQYAKGYVKNHSVGMRYVKIMMAINDEDYPTEKEIWDKYYPEIANKESADAMGFFWAVKEAQVIEGSAVPMGSNIITPTLSVGKDNGAGITTPDDEAAKKALRENQKQFFINLI
jgi:hypothetical protein